jgi:putative addiction module component (TIGR02574 family)
VLLTEFPNIEALSTREKLELVDEIWKSVAVQPDSMEVLREEKDLLDQRWADFLRNPSSALTVDEFKGRMNIRRA